MDVASRSCRLRSWRSAASALHHARHRSHIVTAPFSAPSPSPPPSGPPAADGDDPAEESIFVTNRSFWTKKIHLLCSGADPGGGVVEALRLLDRLRLRGYRPDSLNLSSVVHGLCAAGRFLEGHRRLVLSVASGWVPDDRTSNVLVARLLDARSPDATRRVVDCLMAAKPAFVLSSPNYNRLIDQFCSQSRLADARGIFLGMKKRGHTPDIISYTTLIGGFGRAGQVGVAQQLFDEMTAAGVPPNSLTYSALIRAVLRTRWIERAREMVEELWTMMEREKNPHINNAAFSNLVDAFSREGYFHDVFRLAEEMPHGKLVDEHFAYGQMMDSLCRVGRHHGASRVVYIMRKRGLTPSLVSYNCIVHGLSKEREGGCLRAYQLFKEGAEFEYSPPESTYKALVEGLCRAGDLHKAEDVTEVMLRKEGINRKRIYNMFLNALGLSGVDPGDQLNVLVSMFQNRCHPDVVTLNTIIHGFCKFGRIDEALKILEDMLEGNFCAPDMVTFTTILHGLLCGGRVQEALDILHEKMPACSCSPPSKRTYNVVLQGLFNLRRMIEAMVIFYEMTRKGVTADSMTHAIVMRGLLAMGSMDHAKRFWEAVVWPSGIHDDFVYAATLRGLCTLGKQNEAYGFLYELVDWGANPGIVNYNVLINDACKMGSRRRAYQVVSEMRKNGLIPDAVTWRTLERLHGNKYKDCGPIPHVPGSDGIPLEEVMPGSPSERTAEFSEVREVEIEMEQAAFDYMADKEYPVETYGEEIHTHGKENDEGIRRTEICTGNACKEESLPSSSLTREPLSIIARRIFGRSRQVSRQKLQM